MAAIAPRPLTPAERTALEQVLADYRRNARRLYGVITTFVVPLLATMAFVATYPPFWRPSLAASAGGIAVGVFALHALWGYRIFRPIRRLQADLATGQTMVRRGEVRTCEAAPVVVTVTLAEQPREPLPLFPPLAGDDLRRELTVGQQVELELLPQSGRLVTVRQAG